MKLLQRIIGIFLKPKTDDATTTNVININSGDPLGAYRENSDLVECLEFHATLQLRTPLKALMMDGMMHSDKSHLPELGIETWQGIWVAKLKTWRELGYDIDEMDEGKSASDIGYISRDAYLPFLKAVRSVVEKAGSIDDRVKQLSAELKKHEWSEFLEKHQGADVIINTFFPFFIDTLPGVSASIKEQLRLLGFKTADQLSGADLDVLTSIKGVGKVKASSLQQYADGIIDNRVSERLDLAV